MTLCTVYLHSALAHSAFSQDCRCHCQSHPVIHNAAVTRFVYIPLTERKKRESESREKIRHRTKSGISVFCSPTALPTRRPNWQQIPISRARPFPRRRSRSPSAPISLSPTSHWIFWYLDSNTGFTPFTHQHNLHTHARCLTKDENPVTFRPTHQPQTCARASQSVTCPNQSGPPCLAGTRPSVLRS